MSKTIKLKQGFNINLAGKAQKNIVEGVQPETFAIKPPNFMGLERPKLLVNEGDSVKAGTPLFFDKKKEEIMFTSPVSGEVAEVIRGEKRKILEIRILADKQMEYESFNSYSVSDLNNLDRKTIVDQLLKSGVWANLVQRPYGILADYNETPKSIFISAFDSHPLAPDYDVLFKGEEQNLQAGIDALKKLTEGTVHLNIDSNREVSPIFSHLKNVQLNRFSGPHPAGNVGVQIHHLDPINKGDVVWTVKPQGLVEIGKLFLEGKYDASRKIAVVGSEVKTPQYYQTYTGAGISKFIQDNVNGDHVRFISGNVLTGERIKSDGYVGYFDSMVTVIPEGDHHEFLGWILPSTKKISFHRAFGLLSFMNKGEFAPDTNTHGEERAFVMTGKFEEVTPMDIYPTFLLKAILAEDFDEMEALGLYEVIEEDLALCEFIDVSKHDVQSIIRNGLDLLQYS